MLEKVTHSSRRNMSILLSSRNDDSLNIRSQLTVCIRNRPLSLKINHIPHTTHYVSDTKFMTLVNGQVVVLDDADTLHTGCRLSYYIYPLLIREETSLVDVHSNCDNDFIKHSQSPLEDVEMACSKRIEGSGE